MKARQYLVGGVLAMMAAGLCVQTPASAASPASTASTYKLSRQTAGGQVSLTGTKKYNDGSTSYTFVAKNLGGHGNRSLLYQVNANNPSASAAASTSREYKATFSKPLFGGQVREQDLGGGIWEAVEVSNNACRISLGFSYRTTAALITDISSNRADCTWEPNYTLKVSKALLARL